MQYTKRQLEVIAHFYNYFSTFARGEDSRSICVWRADFGFIYPQEIEELIDMGCEYFSVEYPEHPNMWTSPNYRIERAIVNYRQETIHEKIKRTKRMANNFGQLAAHYDNKGDKAKSEMYRQYRKRAFAMRDMFLAKLK